MDVANIIAIRINRAIATLAKPSSSGPASPCIMIKAYMNPPTARSSDNIWK
jgi:hypothetical protein